MKSTEKFLKPIVERERELETIKEEFDNMTTEERINLFKMRYGLTHGKGKRKYKKKK